MSIQELTAEGAQVICSAEVWLDGDRVDVVPIEDGSVTADATARVLRSCNASLAGDIPTGPASPLAPIGSELRLFRGARDWTGEEYLEPLGHFAFDATNVDRGDRLVKVGGFDYSQVVSDARWEEPYEIARGTNLADAVVDAVQSRLPDHLWQPPNVVATSATVPETVWGEERENDPWADVQSLARADGKAIYFDVRGRLTLVPVPDPDEVPVTLDLTVGESPLLLTTSRKLDGRAYNVVVAVGETEDDDPPVTATAEDTNPASPSYVGRYRRPYFMASSYIGTVAQANDAARGELNRRIGLGEVVSASIVPAPWLDVWQVIRARDDDLHIDARYAIDQLSMPLRPGEASITTRRRRI